MLQQKLRAHEHEAEKSSHDENMQSPSPREANNLSDGQGDDESTDAAKVTAAMQQMNLEKAVTKFVWRWNVCSNLVGDCLSGGWRGD